MNGFSRERSFWCKKGYNSYTTGAPEREDVPADFVWNIRADEELDGVPVVAARAPFLGRGVAAGDERPEAEYRAVRSPHESFKRTVYRYADNELSGFDEVLVVLIQF